MEIMTMPERETLPDLKIIKPDGSELVHRVYSPTAGSHAMSFGVLLAFPLQVPGQDADIAFTSIWEHAAQALPKGDILDEGWPKPFGEFLAAGCCHAPKGHSSQPVSAHISIGSLSKRLAVFGRRRASIAGGITAPEPFVSIPLTLAHAFGGAGHEYNPDGKGLPDEQGDIELPNIELPDHLMMSRADRPPVAGFGPLPAVWPHRAQHLGKQDQHWRDTRWPHLPEDTDARYFMAAPPDQQLQAFWSGGEPITVRNMHPEFPELVGQVPRSRARFFVHQSDSDGEAHFRELYVHADTVWLLPGQQIGIMIYRGSIGVSDPDGRDINAFYAAFENPDEPQQPVEHYVSSCLKAMAPELFQAIPDVTSPEFEASLQSLVDTNLLEKVREQREYFQASLQQAGVHETELLQMLQANPHTRQFAQTVLQRNSTLTGFFNEIESLIAIIQSEDADPATATAATAGHSLKDALTPYPRPAGHAVRAQLPADSSDNALHDASAAARNRQIVLNAKSGGYSCANLDLSNANLAGLDLGGMDFTGSILAGANLAGAKLQGAEMNGIFAPRARFDAADLSGCRLSGASLGGASFTGAVLRAANLETSDCTGASFAGADLSHASLTGAVLSRAWLQGIQAERLNAAGAHMDHANLDNAWLPAAQLDGVSLAGASAQRINLQEASANNADFSQADLQGANLAGARLAGSQTGPGTSLQQARLDQAILQDASWTGADLREASLRGIQARGADFSDALLSEALLVESDLRNCAFDRASLERASLEASNLMEASFIHGKLQNCNFDKCNLYNATFKDPDIAGASFRQANLDRTLLTSS